MSALASLPVTPRQGREVWRVSRLGAPYAILPADVALFSYCMVIFNLRAGGDTRAHSRRE